MAINVEVLGGSVTLSHFTEEITDKHHVRLASVSDVFTPTGRTTLHINLGYECQGYRLKQM